MYAYTPVSVSPKSSNFTPGEDMSITVTSRICGTVCIIDCAGRIMAGQEAAALEAAIEEAQQEFSRIVLNLARVTRVDSMGLGMMVRQTYRVSTRGGSIRIAAPQPFVGHLLGITKLNEFLRSYATEQEAIESFLGACPPPIKEKRPGPTLLVFDQSSDLCAFVRSVLSQNGFHVKTVCSLRDARILLCADQVDYLLIGPCTPQLTSQMVFKELTSLAPKASALQLAPDFHSHDAAQATQALLQMLGVASA